MSRPAYIAAALVLCASTAALADPVGSGASLPASRVGLSDGLTYDGGDGGRPAIVSGPVSMRPAGPSIEATAIVGPKFRAWLKGFGFYSSVGSDSFGPGYKIHGAGVVAGVDRFITPSFLLGAAVGWTGSRTESPVLTSDANAASESIYASWFAGGIEANALAGISQTEFNNARTLAAGGVPFSTRGDAFAPGFNAAADIGYRFQFASPLGAAYVKPLVGVNYTEVDRRGYQESVDGGAGSYLQFPSQSFRRLSSLAGADFGWTSMWDGLAVRPEFRLAWVHDYIDPSPVVDAALVTGAGIAPFSTRDPEPGRDGLVVGAQLTVWKTQGLQAYASYAGEFRGNADTHVGTIGLRVAW